MFATVLGGLPRPPAAVPHAKRGNDDAIRAAIATQEAAGIEPVTDGRLRRRDWLEPLTGLSGLRRGARDLPVEAAGEPRWAEALTVAEWQAANELASSAVKQSLPGPYTAGRRIEPGSVGRERLTLALADALRAEIGALTAAGCPMVEIDEPEAMLIGDASAERRLFADAHRRLAAGSSGVHLSLAITGGNADTAGVETILAAPYASFAFDLIAGPDNWRLVTRVPGDRGIVCGALDSRPGSDDSVELLAWAAHYAASSNGRGLDRVGLAVIPGLEREAWSTVVAKLERLGRAAAVAGLTGDELAGSIDPRAVDIRSAAMGRVDPKARRRRRGL
jgi:methionine synthase II (cobalamin-independent)